MAPVRIFPVVVLLAIGGLVRAGQAAEADPKAAFSQHAVLASAYEAAVQDRALILLVFAAKGHKATTVCR